MTRSAPGFPSQQTTAGMPGPHSGPDHERTMPRAVGYPIPPPHRRAAPRSGAAGFVVAAAIGSLVAVGLGVYGRTHEPTSVALNIAGFSSGIAAKSWLATGAFLLALVQLWSAAALYGRVGRRWRAAGGAPGWVAGLHRWSGRAAVLLTVPVAVHCLYALGFADGTTRVLVHSLAGCFLYGVFVTKMLVLQRPTSPRWSLPLLGGLLFTSLTAVWLSSAVWFFSTSGLSF
ncbi:DUF6529 family protein [Pseudonocardia cypriaca]|uniref:Uncharacterized protein n=1 Tax=Pseudonocardia cypriaca TaxID=882449 RepID=A0A543GH53_9PSEU|nr:DUF6529 family protein [Pseudonocardia cypriaca]TQM45410.1 hypothetical protein FB388_2810 [Pseudonocardia cypriaca]